MIICTVPRERDTIDHWCSAPTATAEVSVMTLVGASGAG